MSEYNASDPRSIRRAAKQAKQASLERQGIVLNLMSSSAGRNYVYDTLLRSHIFSSSFSNDPLVMAFAEGERNAGLQLLTDVMAFAPDQYVSMMREANDRNNADGRRTDADGSDRSGTDNDRDDRGSVHGNGSVIHDYNPGEDAASEE